MLLTDEEYSKLTTGGSETKSAYNFYEDFRILQTIQEYSSHD